MATRDRGGESAPATNSGTVSTRRQLLACCAVLAGFALALTAASLIGDRLRPPLDRVPVATYAARRGLALPTPPATPPGGRPAARSGVATITAGRLTPTAGAAPISSRIAPGTDPQLVAEVTAAYLRAWQLWAEACLTLDPAPLEGGFAALELDRARSYVRQLRASGRALRLDAAHRVTVLELDGDTALVLDELTDRSRYLDPATRQPLAPGAQPTPAGAERVRCRLQRTASGWRVVDLAWGR